MKLPQISKGRSGFTLIELLIVMAIVIGLFSFGALIDLGTIKRENLSAAQSTLVSILEKARSRAMNNVGAIAHNVEVKTDQYILDGNEIIKRNSNIIITKGGADEFTVSFAQLSGEASDLGDIILSDGTQSKTVSLKEAGLIDW